MVDEEFLALTCFYADTSSVSLRLPPSPTGEGFRLFLRCLLINMSTLCRNVVVLHCWNRQNGTKPPLCVILSGGRSPESNPEGDRRSGSTNAERTKENGLSQFALK